jgi:hypothetical protein
VIAFEEKAAGAHGSIRLGLRKGGDATVFTAHALGFEGAHLIMPGGEQGSLALRLARGLTTGQGGELHLEPGDGFTVCFSLPNATPTRRSPEPGPSGTPAANALICSSV